jgi:hypothetical protein
LFFLDEATALAAGHRPCALCRREDYARLVAAWRELHPGRVGADAIDAQLHSERIDPGTREKRLHDAPFADLPDGAFVLHEGGPHVVLGSHLARWTASGYVAAVPRPSRRQAVVITPPSLVSLLRTDRRPLVPLLHPSAFEVAASTA